MDEAPGSAYGPDSLDDENYFERLPFDAILKIFEWLPIDEVVKLRNESTLLNSAVRYHLTHSMVGLRRNCAQALPWLQNRLKDLPVNLDSFRLDLVKSISLVRYLSKEIEILFASVWRLRDDERAWTELAPDLAPVIQEFNNLVSSQTNSDVSRRFDLSVYWMRQLLVQWHQFLDKIDTGLVDRLYAMASRKTPFEIHVIDMLMCAPSYNFQLGLRRRVTGGPFYDVYGFFKTANLKPVGQVPDVFNAELNIVQKKRTLLKYLRETVQRENLSFLGNMCYRIHDLELVLMTMSNEVQDRNRVWSLLSRCYEEMQQSPYSKVMKKNKYLSSKELYEEYYVRCSHENVSYTGLNCVIVAPQQEVRNLPLVVPFLRGRRQKLLDSFDTVDMEGSTDLSNLIPPFIRQEGDGVTSSSNEGNSQTTGSSNKGVSSTKGNSSNDGTSNTGNSSTTNNTSNNGISSNIGNSSTTSNTSNNGSSTSNNPSSATLSFLTIGSPSTTDSSASCSSTVRSTSKAEIRGSNAKPRLQLVIHCIDHMSSVRSPSEVVVNIGYDDNDTCYLSYHNLMGEPLHPIRPPSPTT